MVAEILSFALNHNFGGESMPVQLCFKFAEPKPEERFYKELLSKDVRKASMTIDQLAVCVRKTPVKPTKPLSMEFAPDRGSSLCLN